jgi:hypothetical protein
MTKSAAQAIHDGLNAVGVPAAIELASGIEQIMVALDSGERMEIMQLPNVQAPSILQFYVPLAQAGPNVDRDGLRRLLAILNLRLPLPAVELLEPSGSLHLRYMLACLDEAIDFERVLATCRMLAYEVERFGPLLRQAAEQGEKTGMSLLDAELKKG